tara:strand:+ start:639 stop:1142 length:504 start_codon:yes stop_codon:yes gene_type:complete
MENKIGVYFTENEISSVIKALNSCPGNEKEVESNFILASDLKKILHSHKENSIQNPFKDTPETSSFMKKMEKQYPQTMGAFKEFMNEQYRIFAYKQADYGPGNISMNNNINLAILGLGVRMNDKTQRVLNLAYHKNDPKNESLRDSFSDLSIYGLIAQIVLDGKWGK